MSIRSAAASFARVILGPTPDEEYYIDALVKAGHREIALQKENANLRRSYGAALSDVCHAEARQKNRETALTGGIMRLRSALAGAGINPDAVLDVVPLPGDLRG